MSNRISIVRGTSASFEVDLVDGEGDAVPLDSLIGATAEFLVRILPTDVSNILRFTTVANPTSLSFKPGAAALLLSFVPSDTTGLTILNGGYVYQLEVTLADGGVLPTIEWSPLDLTLGGSSAPPPPPFDNTVKIDHNYQLPDDLTYVTPGGSPIIGAQIRLYLKSDYDAGLLNNPVGITMTDASGHWINPILVLPGYSYIVRFEQPYSFGPDTKEIFA